jgi:hypothetical protein
MTEWKPISRAQERFLALPDTIKEAFFGGSAGPGKSECLMMYPIIRQFIKHPRFKALLLRRTYRELKLEIIPRSREIYTAFGGRFNGSDLVWDFSREGGGLIFFGHCEHESDVYKYDTMEINLSLFDELQTFTEFIYTYIVFSRGRSSVPELPAIARAGGMPGNIGHTWVNKRFIKPEPSGNKIIVGKGNQRRIFIFSTLADVKDKLPTLQEYYDSLDALPSEAEKRAKKYGDWNAYEGMVFEEFRDKHHSDEPDNALHIIPAFDIPDWWPRIVVIDWGFAASNYVCYGAISPTKRLYIYREQSWKRTKIEVWAPFVKEHLDRENVKLIKVCKSAGQDRGQEHTIQQQIENALGRNIELSPNTMGSRVAGKVLLHEYLRWEQKHIPISEKLIYNEELALSILRNKGEEDYNKYMRLFKDSELEINIPKLQIFDKSPEGTAIVLLPEAIKACIYSKTNVEDVADFDGDDPYDNIRYMVDAADNFFGDAKNEQQKLEQREQLVKDFEETQDWNRLFMKARAIERNSNSIRSVSRYHRH